MKSVVGRGSKNTNKEKKLHLQTNTLNTDAVYKKTN